MSTESLFYASLSGDKKYFVSNFLAYFAGLTDNGIVSNKGSSLAVVPMENMTVKIQNGILVDNGNMARVFGDGEEIVIANADGALARIDRIVMRNSVTNRSFTPVYLKGTAAAAPTPPAPVRDGDSCDYVLCTITIPKGTTAVTAAMIKDERQNKALCGLIFGLGQAVDTTALFAQFEAVQADKLADFKRWFDDIKSQLGSDAAGNLLNLIEGLKAKDTAQDVVIAGKADKSQGFFPADIKLTAAANIPAGWLLCDGSAVSRSAYAVLFAATGTTYGVGNGSTTFNLPNLSGRVPVGKSTETEFSTLGKTGGEKAHTLTVAEMPSHDHRSKTQGGALGTDRVISRSDCAWAVYSNYIYTGAAGGNSPHNNLQPYITLNYIIYTGQ